MAVLMSEVETAQDDVDEDLIKRTKPGNIAVSGCTSGDPCVAIVLQKVQSTHDGKEY